VGQRHQLSGLVGGIAEHVALVASTNVVLLLANVYSTGNIRALLLDANHDVAALVVEAKVAMIESNVLHSVTDNLLEIDVSLGRDYSKDDHQTSLGASL
jgi:hypothetical protein